MRLLPFLRLRPVQLPMLVACAMPCACAGGGNRPAPAPTLQQSPIAQVPHGPEANVTRAAGPDAGGKAAMPPGRKASVTRAAGPDAGGGPTLPRSWIGQGTQDDGQSWPMELTIRSFGPGHCADVVYPPGDKPMRCTAEWFCEDDSSGGLLHGVERVTSGRDRCIDWCAFSADLENATVVFKCHDVTGTVSLQPARP